MSLRDSRAMGHAMAIAAAVSFATGTAFAVVAYRDGASPLSVTTLRTTFALIAIFALVRATGGVWRLGRRDRWLALAIGLVLAVQSISHYIAVQRLPLALATLIFYLYPFLIALGAHLFGLDRITPAILAALAVAFCGLVLVLDIGGSVSVDAWGVAFALVAALGFTLIALGTQPMLRRAPDSRAVSIHLHVTAVAIFIVSCLALDSFPLPETRAGQLALLVVPFFYTAAVVMIFFAIASIGSVRLGLVMNIEPVAAIVFGFVLLGQDLTWTQLFGAALVIGAIVALRWDSGRGRR